MCAITFEQAFLKYRPDQERDDHGRFADEGGRAGRGKTKGIEAEYKRRFGHPPPKSMSRPAMRRWIDSNWKTAPGQGKDKATRAQWAKEQRQRVQEHERARMARHEQWRQEYDARQAAERALKDAEAAKSALESGDHKQAATKAMDAYEAVLRVPEEDWRKPTTADHFLRFLTSFETTIATMIMGMSAPWGVAISATALYLLGRYAWRKATSLGAYRGVRWPEDTFWRESTTARLARQVLDRRST